jgi:hypothetical protein
MPRVLLQQFRQWHSQARTERDGFGAVGEQLREGRMPREQAHDEGKDRNEGAEDTPRLGPLVTSPQEPLTKEELNTVAEARSADETDRVAVTFKVSEEGYVPSGVTVRAQISRTIFTAQVTREDIDRLQQDPKVISIGTAKEIRPAEG